MYERPKRPARHHDDAPQDEFAAQVADAIEHSPAVRAALLRLLAPRARRAAATDIRRKDPR